MPKMCIKISTFIVLLATILIRKSIASEVVTLKADGISTSSEKKHNYDVIAVGIFGYHEILHCSFKNSKPFKYTWLKNNELLQDSEDLKISKNGTLLNITNINFDKEGIYTCKCEDDAGSAGCQSHTYKLIVEVLTEEERFQRFEKYYLQPMKHIFEWANTIKFSNGSSIWGPNYELFRIEKQDLKTDVQRISINVGARGRFLIVSCFNQYDPFGYKYAWLKDNKPLQSTDAEMIEGHLMIGPVTMKHSGNYTCNCKDTSCVPYTHTYQVEVVDVRDT